MNRIEFVLLNILKTSNLKSSPVYTKTVLIPSMIVETSLNNYQLQFI